MDHYQNVYKFYTIDFSFQIYSILSNKQQFKLAQSLEHYQLLFILLLSTKTYSETSCHEDIKPETTIFLCS